MATKTWSSIGVSNDFKEKVMIIKIQAKAKNIEEVLKKAIKLYEEKYGTKKITVA